MPFRQPQDQPKPLLKPRVIVIVGPTASGKSALAVHLTKQLNGEVISADARQVYKGLNIGTGKVPRDISNIKIKNSISKKYVYKGIVHHLLDVASPRRTFTVARFQSLGVKALRSIITRGKTPIICGGTGFYIDALCADTRLPDVPPNAALRRTLARRSTKELFAQLNKLDPRRARAIDRNNPHRLVRAIEIATALGRTPPIPSHSSPYEYLKIGIALPKETLRKRIKARLIARMKQGMVAEVRKLKKEGLSSRRLESLGLEYRYINRFLERALTKQELITQLERAIWQYARRQMTWFRRDPHIRWLKNKKEVVETVKSFVVH